MDQRPRVDRGKAFVQVLACVLNRLVAANDQQPDLSGVVTKFHALRPPSISIKDYLERINKYAACSPECFVLALVYIDRLIARNHLALTSLNVHRIIITAVMLAAKFFDDQYYNNAYYAKVGGVPCNEVNSLELEFLFSINFSLGVPTEVYERYYVELANHAGVGLPPDAAVGPDGAPAAASTGCDCAALVGPGAGGTGALGGLSFQPDEVLCTGMRSPEQLFGASWASRGAGALPQQPGGSAGGHGHGHGHGSVAMAAAAGGGPGAVAAAAGGGGGSTSAAGDDAMGGNSS